MLLKLLLCPFNVIKKPSELIRTFYYTNPTLLYREHRTISKMKGLLEMALTLRLRWKLVQYVEHSPTERLLADRARATLRVAADRVCATLTIAADRARAVPHSGLRLPARNDRPRAALRVAAAGTIEHAPHSGLRLPGRSSTRRVTVGADRLFN